MGCYDDEEGYKYVRSNDGRNMLDDDGWYNYIRGGAAHCELRRSLRVYILSVHSIYLGICVLEYTSFPMLILLTRICKDGDYSYRSSVI